MSSPRQIAANRRNALNSTGPITPEGKQRARRNAVRHGLTAETVIGALEDAEDYQSFEAVITADYEAETAVERELVLRLASVLWRLRRATSIETALFDSVIAEAEADVEPESSGHKHSESAPVLSTRRDLAFSQAACVTAIKRLPVDSIAPHRVPEPGSTDSNSSLADAFVRLAQLSTFPLDRLSRYEHLLWRQARQIIFTLEINRRRWRGNRKRIFPFPFGHKSRVG